jgi:hypothetical protein
MNPPWHLRFHGSEVAVFFWAMTCVSDRWLPTFCRNVLPPYSGVSNQWDHSVIYYLSFRQFFLPTVQDLIYFLLKYNFLIYGISIITAANSCFNFICIIKAQSCMVSSSTEFPSLKYTQRPSSYHKNSVTHCSNTKIWTDFIGYTDAMERSHMD